jgi:hypothetical protein
MSGRKFHVKHHRTPGGYKRRLAKKGITRSPMTFYGDLWQGEKRKAEK